MVLAVVLHVLVFVFCAAVAFVILSLTGMIKRAATHEFGGLMIIVLIVIAALVATAYSHDWITQVAH